MAPKGLGRLMLEGALAGAAGAYAMGPMRRLVSRFESEQTREREREIGAPPATEVAGHRALGAIGLYVVDEARPAVGQAVHYAAGILFGAAYAVLRQSLPKVPRAAGLILGAAIWLFSDELLVTWLQLAPPPGRFPLFAHARALAAHLAFGLTVDRGLAALGALV